MLSLVLFNMSTHLTAMEELNSDIFQEEKMDWSEWLVEHQTPIIAGSMIGLGAAASACKWDKKYLIGACGLSGCFILYKCMQDSKLDKELNQSFKDLEDSQANVDGAAQSLLNIVEEYNKSHKAEFQKISTTLENQNASLDQISKDIQEQNGSLNSIAKSISEQTEILVEIKKEITDATERSAHIVKEVVNLQEIMSESAHQTEDLKDATTKLLTTTEKAYSKFTADILKELSKNPLNEKRNDKDQFKNRALNESL